MRVTPSTHVVLDMDLRGVSVAALGGFVAELRRRAHPVATVVLIARPDTQALVASVAVDGVRMVLLQDDAAHDVYVAALQCAVLERCGGGAVWWRVGAVAVGVAAMWASRGVIGGAVAAVCGRRKGGGKRGE